MLRLRLRDRWPAPNREASISDGSDTPLSPGYRCRFHPHGRRGRICGGCRRDLRPGGSGVRYVPRSRRGYGELDLGRAPTPNNTKSALDDVSVAHAVPAVLAVSLAGRRRDQRYARWQQVFEIHSLGHRIVLHEDGEGVGSPYNGSFRAGCLNSNHTLFFACLRRAYQHQYEAHDQSSSHREFKAKAIGIVHYPPSSRPSLVTIVLAQR